MTAGKTSSYVIKTGKFEGPLELLLDLIEKRKLSINEVSLAKVADDFIAYVRSLGQFPISESAHFILIASTLLLVKSKSLLPQLDLSTEEEGNIKELERRLALYKRVRDLSRYVRDAFGKTPIFLPMERALTPVFAPHEKITLDNLHLVAKELLKQFPKKEFLPKAVVDKVISLEEMIESLSSRIQKNLKLSFKEFAKVGRQEKVHVIVSFLAMLELVKQGAIEVSQEKNFDEITMETSKLDVPKYA